MKITRELPRIDADREPPELTLAIIREVKDFTARKTLEQAHALVTGLAAVARGAESDEADRALLRDLAEAGITPRDAVELTLEAAALVERMADRDRKAEIFHAAVKEAGHRERAMYERLAALAKALRTRLGPDAPALAKLGVPGDAAESRPRARPAGKAIYSTLAGK
jgi:hypothetical protein